MKSLIHICLLIIALTKINAIEFWKEITFDRNHNKFDMIFNDKGALLIWAKFPAKDAVYLKITFPKSEIRQLVKPEGVGRILPFKELIPFRIELEYEINSNEKGIIWMQDSINAIQINISNIRI